jgi:hypothetical protein
MSRKLDEVDESGVDRRYAVRLSTPLLVLQSLCDCCMRFDTWLGQVGVRWVSECLPSNDYSEGCEKSTMGWLVAQGDGLEGRHVKGRGRGRVGG